MDPLSYVNNSPNPTLRNYKEPFKQLSDPWKKYEVYSLARMSSDQILALSEEQIRHYSLFDNQIGHIQLMPILDQGDQIEMSIQELGEKQVDTTSKQKNPNILNIGQQNKQFETQQKIEKKKSKMCIRQLKSFASFIYETIASHGKLTRDQLFTYLGKYFGKKIARLPQRRIYDILNVLHGSNIIIYSNKIVSLPASISNRSQIMKQRLEKKIKQKKQLMQQMKQRVEQAMQRLYSTRKLLETHQIYPVLECQKKLEFPVTMISTEVVEKIYFKENQVCIQLRKENVLDVSCLDGPSIIQKLKSTINDGEMEIENDNQSEEF